jgi:hypothetical protein
MPASPGHEELMMDQMIHSRGADFSYDADNDVAVDAARKATIGLCGGPLEPEQACFAYKDGHGEARISGTWIEKAGSSRTEGVRITERDLALTLPRYFGRLPAANEAKPFIDYLAKFIAFFLEERNAALGAGRQNYRVETP